MTRTEARINAAARHLKKFTFPDDPCNQCNGAEFYVQNGGCTTCTKRHNDKRRAMMRERLDAARAAGG